MPKRFRVFALSFWPGLPQIWSGQEVLGLLLGLLFASTLNLAIATRWIWSEAFAPGWADFFAILAIASWIVSLGYTLWWVGLCHPDRHRREIERLFREAHEAYLQGRWKDSRLRLERILAATRRTRMRSCSSGRCTSGRSSPRWLVRCSTSVYS